MKTLTIQQNLTPSSQITKAPTSIPKTHKTLHHNHHKTPLPPQSWRLNSGPKGFTGTPREKQNIPKKTNKPVNVEDDDKIPDAVFERMIKRILFYVGVPLATGFLLLQVFSVLKKGVWDVPIWLPFLTTFITFGASVLGIAYGSLSTSLDEDEEGSFLGFEQVEKNWVEMWKEEDESGDR